MYETVLRLDLDVRTGLGRRFTPDALIVQEDRYLVMSPPAFLDLDQDNDLDAAYLAISRHRPLRQGRYLVLGPHAGASFWTYQAVVHDLELRPSCQPGDIGRCLRGITRDALQRGLTNLASEPLGLREDVGLKEDEWIGAWDAAVFELVDELKESLRLTVLLEDAEHVETVSMALRSWLLRRATRRFRTVDGDAAVVEVQGKSGRLHFRFVPGSPSGYQVTRPTGS